MTIGCWTGLPAATLSTRALPSSSRAMVMPGAGEGRQRRQRCAQPEGVVRLLPGRAASARRPSCLILRQALSPCDDSPTLPFSQSFFLSAKVNLLKSTAVRGASICSGATVRVRRRLRRSLPALTMTLCGGGMTAGR